MIYLDNAATTQVVPEVLKEMMPYLTTEFGNAGSLHSLGRKSVRAIEKARKQVADCIGAQPNQIIFTSGGTEANNLVLQGLIPYLKEKGKTHIITTKIEHDSIIKTVEEMCIKHGFDISYLEVNQNGKVDMETLSNAITERTGLISMMYINNEIGSVNNILTASTIAHNHGILFHSDCVQALGSVKIDVKALSCDFVSISSHKIYGAKGIGALYAKCPSLINPLIIGGDEQEFGLRGGTENVPAIVGFGKACEVLKKNHIANSNCIEALKNIFYSTLISRLKEYGLEDHVSFNGASPYDCGKILNLRFDGVDAQTLVLYLSNKDVYVSSGSACRNHSSKPSSVLLAIGLSPEQARSSVRFSFSHLLTMQQSIEAAQITADAIKLLLN